MKLRVRLLIKIVALHRFVAMRTEVPKLCISSSFLLPITPLNAA
jgi:hypothetical protein